MFQVIILQAFCLHIVRIVQNALTEQAKLLCGIIKLNHIVQRLVTPNQPHCCRYPFRCAILLNNIDVRLRRRTPRLASTSSSSLLHNVIHLLSTKYFNTIQQKCMFSFVCCFLALNQRHLHKSEPPFQPSYHLTFVLCLCFVTANIFYIYLFIYETHLRALYTQSMTFPFRFFVDPQLKLELVPNERHRRDTELYTLQMNLCTMLLANGLCVVCMLLVVGCLVVRAMQQLHIK